MKPLKLSYVAATKPIENESKIQSKNTEKVVITIHMDEKRSKETYDWLGHNPLDFGGRHGCRRFEISLKL